MSDCIVPKKPKVNITENQTITSFKVCHYGTKLNSIRVLHYLQSPVTKDVLELSGRKEVTMKGDGNCFYRAISYQLFGTQKEDYLVRSVISQAENLNKTIFSNYLISGINKPTIEEHINTVRLPGVWATQVEVLATAHASVFEVPVYSCSQNKDLQCVNWKVVYPYKSSKHILKMPEFPDIPEGVTLQKPTHFELLYYDSMHYNAIVSIHTGKACLEPPQLANTSSELINLTT